MQNNLDIASQQLYYNNRWNTEKYLNGYELKRAIAILSFIGTIRNHLPTSPSILDLGCGRGWLSSMLSVIGPTSAIDLSENAILSAKQKYPEVDFYCGNLFDVIRNQNSFDLIVSQEVIEHVEDQVEFINLVSCHLKKGGYFIFTTPNKWIKSHQTEAEHKSLASQPIENWIGIPDIHNLLTHNFKIVKLTSIILGYGTTGIAKIVNSHKFNNILGYLGLAESYNRFRQRKGYGLHLVVLAKKH